MITPQISRVARQVARQAAPASKRLFTHSTTRRAAHQTVVEELQGYFKKPYGVDSQPADWSKMIKHRMGTFVIYSTGMGIIMFWPLGAAWALDGRM